MPRLDGTGPMGMGSMTGRGMGNCSNTAKTIGTIAGIGIGLGLGCRRGLKRGLGRGMGRTFFGNPISSENEKELLANEKAILEERLKAVNNKLND